jgi:hypothetical protein
MRLAHRNALRDRIRALPEVSGRHVDWSALRQNAPLPAVRLVCISDLVGASHQGSDKRAEALVQIDAFADDPNAAQAIRDAILSDLHGFKGTLDGAVFDAVIHDGSREDDDGAGSYSASVDLRIIYIFP